MERDLARYWSNWYCKWLFWKERQIVLYRRQAWKTWASLDKCIELKEIILKNKNNLLHKIIKLIFSCLH